MNYDQVTCIGNDCVGQLSWLQGEKLAANHLGSFDMSDGKPCLVYEMSTQAFKSESCTQQAMYVCEYDCMDTGYLGRSCCKH